MTKRLLAALALLGVVSSSAWAAVNVRQEGDGTASTVGAIPRIDYNSCLGGVTLPTFFAMNTLSTGVVISPITNAVVRNIVAGRMAGQTTGTNMLTFWTYQVTPSHTVLQEISPIMFRGRPSGELTRAFININAGGVTQTGMLSTIAQMNQQRVTNDTISLFKHTLGAGDIVAVQSGGGATASGNAITGIAFVQICPR